MNQKEGIVGVVRGTGSCLPHRIMDNIEIADFVDTSDEWIRERTGVISRRIATVETTASMACDAAARALENADVLPEAVDLIIVATASPDQTFPCTACSVQKSIDAVNAACFDLNGACSGFIFAYNTAQAYISSGVYRTILVIGSESMTRLVDWTDRGTCILFGDGAGAVLLKADTGRQYISAVHSDGYGTEALTGPGVLDRVRSIDTDQKPMQTSYITMNGKDVFQFAARKVPQVINEILAANEMTIEDIDLFLLHQANSRIVDAVARRLGADREKFPMNLQNYGNTSSASIPILLDELNQNGRLHKGQKIIVAGFGAGLSWGASMLEWK